MAESTLVKISPTTKSQLDLLKVHPRETYEDVLKRLLETVAPAKKGIVAKVPIARGETLTPDKLAVAETDRGLSPRFLSLLEGFGAMYDIKQGEPITFGLMNFQHRPQREAQAEIQTSIIIRTKNEEAWLARCLAAIMHQEYQNFEVIVVDNDSSDSTREIAKSFSCTILSIGADEFNYSRALNRGIQASKGKYIVMISGHCVPINHKWLGALVQGLADQEVAGVYGRQEPLPDSDPFDKRDLWTTFGVERRIQRKDFFFHNANSAIKRALWEATRFDEGIHGVEDRHWAKQMIERGRTIVYEPDASVYHYHGIHQGRNVDRAERVAKVIELITNGGN